MLIESPFRILSLKGSQNSHPVKKRDKGGHPHGLTIVHELALSGGSGMRELVAEFVNDLLPDFVFEEIIVAGGAQHSELQDFMLLAQQCLEFASHALGSGVFHSYLG
jgi:hypothetical protein